MQGPLLLKALDVCNAAKALTGKYIYINTERSAVTYKWIPGEYPRYWNISWQWLERHETALLVDELERRINESLAEPRQESVLEAMSCHFPSLIVSIKHPMNGSMVRLDRIVMSLNDFYEWSRAEIADWLETLDLDITMK